ncbi:MAG: type II secretion system major pseudopilin GspG [Verrucomicrobiota bacterium]
MKTRIVKRSGRFAAFTLIEMVLVLAIVALLVGASTVALVGILVTTKEQIAERNILSIETALANYQIDNKRLPTEGQGLTALSERPSANPVPRRWKVYIEPLPADPWGRNYVYRIPAKKSNKGFDLFSTGEDGQEGTDDDIGNSGG